MNKETEIWQKKEKQKTANKTWENFANSSWLLAQIYPEIKENEIWHKLVELELIREEKGN